MTVGQWLDIWLATRHGIRPATRRIYTQLVRDYLRPGLGNVALRELTIGRVQAMFTCLLRANAARVRPLSPTTLQRIREVLRAALNGAIRRELITSNPARWVELPSLRRPRAVVWTEARVAVWRATGERPPVAVWTAEQTAAFLRHAGSHPLHAVFHVAALTGLRRGEVLGLRWCDLDLVGASLTVTHQIQERDGRAVICLPKSAASGRAVSLDRGTVALLVRLRSAQRREGGGAADGWVFARENGSHWSPSYVSHTFRPLIEKADLPPVRFHDLRHGAATLSLAAGNDLKTVQALLGHASIVLTADTYTSVLPSLAQACAEATASLVRRAGYDRGRKICRSGARSTRHGRRRAVGRGPRFIRAGGTLGGTHSGPSADPQIDKAHRQRP
ncbi:tyrosine-type recombinase/integrase [Amycolatopsis rubida]|uniref:tyrosine-type recombinase/integrase n=1 Tax=Amycolatopsis rubida TaxID=112413 RepID=UPI000B87D50B|nr:site-specific integrase [Amycolatopsis rubida]